MYLRQLPDFEYHAPASLAGCLSLLKQHREQAKVMAGGTDLLVRMRYRQAAPAHVIGIRQLAGLRGIVQGQGGSVSIGALTSHQEIAESPIIREQYGPLAAACGRIGTPQVRLMGTIGGNICNAGPSQDSVPALLALGAGLKLVSAAGERTVPVDRFFTGPYQTVLQPDELLTTVEIPPLPPRSAGAYRWLNRVGDEGETLVGVAVVLTRGQGDTCQDARIALCSVAPAPFRAGQAETVLRGQKIDGALIELAADAAAGEARPRSQADYRRRMVRLLVGQTIDQVWRQLR